MKTDLLKAALEKKNAGNGTGSKKNKLDTKGQGVRSQVSTNKPARKSAGRGR